MPNIAVINESTAISNAEVQKLLPAFTEQWNQDLLPIWGVDKAMLTFVPKSTKPEQQKVPSPRTLAI